MDALQQVATTRVYGSGVSAFYDVRVFLDASFVYFCNDKPMKVLFAIAMTSPCDRSWSAQGLIHTKLRNGLSVPKLEMLVHVATNLT
jgi:hypothetical protein